MDFRIAYFHVFTVLEGIVPLKPELIDPYIGTVHEYVVALARRHLVQFRMAAMPEGFLGIGQPDALQLQPVHVAEHFRGFNKGVHHAQIPAIPDGGPGPFPEDAVPDEKVFIVPEGVFPREFTLNGFNSEAFLQGRFSGEDRYVAESQVADGKEGAFASVRCVADVFFFHDDVCC